ncbi:MAG: FtsX-like permease family protein [Acidobacteria bacterium]|nr:FtsX-like permease family protein [Acidobacteriota bacterium]
MYRTTWKTILANKRRLLNTFISIAFGVAFIAGTFIYGDTTAKAFENLFANAFAGVDINVQPEFDPELSFGGDTVRMADSVIEDVQRVDGVDEAWGSVGGFAAIVGPDGEQAGSGGAPSFGANWPDVRAETGFDLISGTRPTGPTEVAVDGATFEAEELALGDTLLILSADDRREFTLVGVVGFGGETSIGGATFALFDTATAQEFFNAEGQVDSIQATVTSEADVADVITAVEGVVPSGVVVTSGQTAAEEQARQVNDQIGFLTTFLQVFAFIALFVSTFIISNTFRIIVVQRTRELALLRALGATARQVTRMVMVESLIVGFVSSVIGVGLGLLLAIGLRSLLEVAGLTLPSTSLQLSVQTVVIAILVGTVVTLVSAFIPARRASRVAPVEAMRVDMPVRRGSFVKRAFYGTALLALGVGLLFLGLFADVSLPGQPVIATVGLASLLTVLGVTTLSPLAAPFLTRWLAAPFVPLSNITGRLAQENSSRSPRRTAATAAALMIGVALMSVAAVFAASIQGTIDEIFDTGITAELIAQPQNAFGGQGFTTAFADDVELIPEVSELGRFRQNIVRVDESVVFIAAGDDSFTNLIVFDRIEGQVAGLGTIGFAVDFATAENNEWELGESVEFEFLQTGVQRLELQGLYESPGANGFFISLEAYEANYAEQLDSQVYIKLADGVSLDAGKAAIAPIAELYPTIKVADQDELKSDLETQIFQILGFIFGLLAMALLIALIGVANTITLSIFERTREIGLLRAIGLTRRGVRRMIRLESGVIAAYGAILGVALGIFLAWALLLALRDQGFSQFVIPWLWLVVGVALIGFLGVIAAILPARRAAKLNVLDAIAYE